MAEDRHDFADIWAATMLSEYRIITRKTEAQCDHTQVHFIHNEYTNEQSLLQLLLGSDVAGAATLALAAVGGTGVQTSIAPAMETIKLNVCMREYW